MGISNIDEILAHFEISENGEAQLSVFDSAKIENIGAAVAFDLAKGKGRAVIDYDPAYPFAVLRTITNFPNIPETYKVGLDGERFVLEPVMPMDSKDQCR